MITIKDKPDTITKIDQILHPAVKTWFYSRFKELSLPQRFGVLDIHSRKNILISAPTGATKTLTAFLSILNQLVDLAEKNLLEDRIYCVYCSPLKALNYDIEVNLKTPLTEIQEMIGRELAIRIATRTGDTTRYERTKMLKSPPHILITTPESLAILLTSIKFSLHFKNVEYCVIDEIHALAENKRGVHLSLSLERLALLTPHMTRVGLSATISPLEKIAQYLVGTGKDCTIVDVQYIKELDLKVLSPVKKITETDHSTLHRSLYNLLHKLIQAHRTTLIFTNTRAATERVVEYMRHTYPRDYGENIGAHHGSLSKEFRLSIENRLRLGELKAVVSSTSLELGIDIGYIDLVVLLGSPRSVARCLQRIGRSGHQLHKTAKGRIIVLDRDDLIECSVLLKNAIENQIDNISIPQNSLDVLAQQIYGMAITEKLHIDELYRIIKQSYCYASLRRSDFMDVIQYLSGEYVSLQDRHIYAKIWYDKETGYIGRKGKLARVIYMNNVGTIPDESFITVKVGNQPIGKIDESFLERMKPGDVFVLGGEKYQYQFSKGMVAYVKASSFRPPTIPSWFSEMLPLSYDLALSIGKFRRLIAEKFEAKKTKKEVLDFIHKYLYVDNKAAKAIYEYCKEQFDYAQIGTDKKIIVEYFKEGTKRYIFVHAMFGRRVNDVLSRAIGFASSKLQHKNIGVGINDNGFYLASSHNMPFNQGLRLITSSNLRSVMDRVLDKTDLIKRRFRNCAVRSLMILRNYKGRTKYVGRQQVSSQILINAVRRISNDFSILREARREILEDLMDIDHAIEVLKKIEDGKITIKEIVTDIPSPFAFNIYTQGHLDIMRIEDRVEFLQRMHQNILAKIALKKAKEKN